MNHCVTERPSDAMMETKQGGHEMSDIAKNIKKIRQQNGWTQDRLAQELHVTRQAVSNWETGKSEPDIGTLESIAAALQVDLTELLYGRKGPGKYPQFQKKAVVWAIVLGILAVLTLIDAVVLIPLANEYKSTHYVMWPSSLTRFVVPIIGFLAIGMLIPAVVSLWRNVRPAGKARTVMRIVVVVLLIPWFYILIAMGALTLGQNPPLGKVFSFIISDPFLVRLHLFSYYLPILTGLCLYPAFFAPGGTKEETKAPAGPKE